jgi:hypothetical protein
MKRVCSLILIILFALGCSKPDPLFKLRSTPMGDDKLEEARQVVAQKLLVGRDISIVRELIGEPTFVRDEYIYYRLKIVTREHGFDLNGQYLLVCRLKERLVELCVIQGA